MDILLQLMIWILYLSQADACETIVCGPLNGSGNTGGPWLNIFPDLRVPIDGYLTQITFRKKANGLGYVSFWKWKEDMTYEMVAKIPVQTRATDADIVTQDVNEFFLEGNLSIAIHHQYEPGIFVYEDGEMDVYAEDLRDNDLEIGRNVTFVGNVLTKSVALELVICEMCEPVSMGSLFTTASGGPWLNLFPDIRVPISGWVSSIAFIRKDSGTAFVSFWQWIRDKQYMIMAKVQLGTGSSAKAEKVTDLVYVEKNWSVAIHHANGSGAVRYGANGPNIAYFMDVRDNNLRLNSTIDFNTASMEYKSPAVGFTICICRPESHCDSDRCKPNEPNSGLCMQGCGPGYQGDYCEQACESPQFGLDCNSTCHCLNSTGCDPVNGTCPPGGCLDGYTGDSCSVEVVPTTPSRACESPQFGLDCISTCHCLNSTDCDPVNRTCPPGGCEDGYTGDSCSVEVVPTTPSRGVPKEDPTLASSAGVRLVSDDKGDNTMPIAVGVAVGAGAVLIVVIIFMYIGRRKNNRKPEPTLVKEDSLELEKMESIPISAYHKWRKGITNDMLKQEFHKMETQSTKSTDFALNEIYGNKNKFINVLPYDDNRVVLDPVGDDPTSEYINASPIPGYDSEERFVYIACQGPQSTTVDDFWRMAWQFRVYCIVMLTNLVENYKEKCVQYWPSERTASFGDIQVSLQREEDNHDVIIRHLKVTKKSETRWLRQFQYKEWPDHGVPLATSSCLRLQQEVAKLRRQNPGSPVAVHCSAGVGRTGTFIALDQLVDQAETRGRLNLAYYVKKLRLYRMKMIQTFLQYEFLYMALDQHLTVGITSIDMASPVDTINPLAYTDEGKQRLCDQFQFLEDVHPPFPPSNTTVALRKNNVGKNRDTAVLPADDERILLESEDEALDSDYINAVMVKGDDERSLYCMTQVPLPETTADFWRLILQNYIQNIVYLRDTHREQEHWLPPNNQELTFDLISVTCVGEEKHTDYAVHSLNVGRINDEADEEMYNNVASQESEYANTPGTQRVSEVVNVRLFFLPALDTRAETHDILTATLKFLDVLSCHRVTGQTVAIVCKNGANDCGVFLGCDMVRSIVAQHSLIDVFSVVHRIKLVRPQCITTLDQYRFLHRLALKYNIQLQGEA